MGRPLETIVDERGRVLIPQELREEVGLDGGMVVSLQKGKGRMITIIPARRTSRLSWKDLKGIKPHRTAKPEWPTPEEIKSIWE
jgi:bifunctional DNA-binding transcriptional regulator/antitoxin component of YhaV-PrlF toxin-antitoxin module